MRAGLAGWDDFVTLSDGGRGLWGGGKASSTLRSSWAFSSLTLGVPYMMPVGRCRSTIL